MELKVMALGLRGIRDVQGGVEKHSQQLYPRLAALGCRVEVLVRSPYEARPAQQYRGVRLRRLWAPRRPGLEAFVHSLIGVIYAGFRRPHILHIHSIGPAIVTPIARLLGLKVVVTHHSQNYLHEKWGPLGRWLLHAGEIVGMKASHDRIAVSRALAAWIRQRYGRTAHFIPNGVNAPDLQSEADTVIARGLEPGRYFLLVGRISPEKRPLDLIRAFAAGDKSGWRLALVGGGEDDDYLDQVRQAAEASGTVLTGYLSGAALAQLYTHAGAFVLPSAHEGLPIALLEALSYGLPVLASDIPANREVGLDAENYYPMGDVAALSARMAELVKTPVGAAERDRRRRWVIGQYDWDQVAAETLRVYRAVSGR